jgi:hypothetical protein
VFTVEYAQRLNYPCDEQGNPFPILQLRVLNPSDPENGLDIDAYLDSGAEYSLLAGWIATTIGFDLFAGAERKYGPLVGPLIHGRVHLARLSHPSLGNFDMDVGFSTVEIRRNILGRDFFSRVQIGFREKQLIYYITPTP